jgi:nitrous oxide reductase
LWEAISIIIITERGTINKEKFYIPKDLIEGYNGEVLYFNITEQEAKDICMQNTPPSEDQAKQIVQTITERRSVAYKKEGKEERESKTKEKMIVVTAKEKKKDKKQQLKKISKTNGLSRLEVGEEEEIVEKMKIAASDLKDIIVSGAKVAKEKIKERQEIAAEKKADRDAEDIENGRLSNTIYKLF